MKPPLDYEFINTTFHPFNSSMEGVFQHLTSLRHLRLTPEMNDFINVLAVNQTKLEKELKCVTIEN